jgi:hypothetical protein
VFCKSKRQCKQIIEEREKGNKKLYWYLPYRPS